jgi:hypothetical protein
MNLTDWFPGSTKPVRKGVYQREYIYGKSKQLPYCYWNGKKWSFAEPTVELAKEHTIVFIDSPRQQLPWRGVLK